MTATKRKNITTVKKVLACVTCGEVVEKPHQGHRYCATHMVDEQWKAIPDFAGLYEASSKGRIRSLVRNAQIRNRVYGGQVLAQNFAGARKLVTLSAENVVTTKLVHILVAEAFLGDRGSCPVVAHWDGDGNNNDVTNLRWATYKENEDDKRRHGTDSIGERNPAAKLTWDDVAAIRMMRASGAQYKDISAKFGISKTQCCDICKGKSWRTGQRAPTPAGKTADVLCLTRAGMAVLRGEA